MNRKLLETVACVAESLGGALEHVGEPPESMERISDVIAVAQQIEFAARCNRVEWNQSHDWLIACDDAAEAIADCYMARASIDARAIAAGAIEKARMGHA